LGYKKCICLCVEGGIQEFDLRVEGFAKALHARGISFSEQDVLYSPFSVKDGYRVVSEHAARLQHTDALFAVTDLLAFGALEAIKNLGLRVPGDIAIVGYDDIPLSAELNPPLSSVHQPREEMASETCRRLLQKIELKEQYKAGARIVIRPYLIVRESSGGRRNK
jgi:DNA-binding LacI/PurR family transcriptional regulator